MEIQGLKDIIKLWKKKELMCLKESESKEPKGQTEFEFFGMLIGYNSCIARLEDFINNEIKTPLVSKVKAKSVSEGNTHTKMIFCVKDEPLLGMIQKEFTGTQYSLKTLSDGEFTTIQLNVAKFLEVSNKEEVLIDNCPVQLESFRYYTPKNS